MDSENVKSDSSSVDSQIDKLIKDLNPNQIDDFTKAKSTPQKNKPNSQLNKKEIKPLKKGTINEKENNNNVKHETKTIRKIEDFSKKQISNIKNIVNGKVEKAKEESQVQDSIETNFKNKLSLSTKRQDYLKNKQKNYSQVIQNIKLVNHNSKSSRNNNIITPIRIHKQIENEIKET